jgi:hypothetical protein
MLTFSALVSTGAAAGAGAAADCPAGTAWAEWDPVTPRE